MPPDLNPPVTYWTGTWAPEFEAHSQEVEALRRAGRAGAPVVSAAAGQRRWPWAGRGVLRLDARWVPLVRAAAAWREPRGAVTHVFGALHNWHLLRALGRRPLLFTVTIAGRPAAAFLLDRVNRFAAETADLARRIAALGIAEDRVRLVPPGVDLERFAQAPLPPAAPFRLLFASSPAAPHEFAARGVPLLVELARRRPEIEVVFLWRPWGDVAACRRAFAALGPPSNARFLVGTHADMPALHRSAHAVACCFVDDGLKSAPQSLLEAFASGRPALVTPACGLADLVAERGTGVVAGPEPEALAAAIDGLRARLPDAAARARRLAHERFGLPSFLAAYQGLYEELAAEGPRRAPSA